MHSRELASIITRQRSGYPVIAIHGPRQSGKSTLAQQACPDLPLVRLEDPAEQALMRADWRGFFARHPDGAIIDEAQLVPELFSALQARVDADQRMGRWVLTGSQQFTLLSGISQSLAGRVATLTLWPFAHSELAPSDRRASTLAQAVFMGGYAPLYDPRRQLDPVDWLANHVITVLSKDVPEMIGVRNRSLFARFMGICAALTGQEITKQSFATDLGIDGKTVEAWLSILEAACLIVRIAPYRRNFGKRIVAKPKLYMTDTGLICRLLHIRDVSQLRDHHQWGALVETWCAMEILKARQHHGMTGDLCYWRSSDGHEVDLIIDGGNVVLPIEVKASATPQMSMAVGLQQLRALNARDTTVRVLPGIVLHGGDTTVPLGVDRAIPWHAIAPEARWSP